MEEKLIIKYKSESLEIEFKGSLEDGLKLLTKLEPPRFIYQTISERPSKYSRYNPFAPKEVNDGI